MAAEDGRTTAAVVLGSGGARGYAHIGALQVILERGFDIQQASQRLGTAQAPPEAQDPRQMCLAGVSADPDPGRANQQARAAQGGKLGECGIHF